MGQRKDIFTAGPAVQPEPVLEALAAAVRDYEGSGQSVLELSHRSPAYEGIQARAEAALRRLLGLDEAWSVLFLPGGASTQFSMVPMNLLGEDGRADYIVSGAWSEKALKEAVKVGAARDAGSSKGEDYRTLPGALELDETAVYCHYTSNNTIFGTQWSEPPDAGAVPLVCDASSDILSRPIELARHGLIYAGAQKNAGPAGVTLVLIRSDMIERAKATKRGAALPAMLDYVVQLGKDSRYNTPPVFAVYGVALIAEWLEQQGGLMAMAARNAEKAAKLYGVIDELEFYEPVAAPEARSLMNVCFRPADAGREGAFIEQAAARGLVGLKGHRSVGGLRASLYNALPVEAVDRLTAFMREFASA